MNLNFIENVILVDENDREIGQMEKLEAHQRALRHRAISAFVFNHRNELLLQKRAAGKYHSPDLWANTCCSHPRPGETARGAAERRLREEMGFICSLQFACTLEYRAELGDLTEHEIDHLFTGIWDGTPEPEPQEVSEWRWISLEELEAEIAARPENFVVWLPLLLPELRQTAL